LIGILLVNGKNKADIDTKGEKIRDLTAMKVDMHHDIEPKPNPKPDPKPKPKPDPKPVVLHLSGQSQNILKSTCIPGILEDEAAYMKESVIRFINATEDLVGLNGS